MVARTPSSRLPRARRRAGFAVLATGALLLSSCGAPAGNPGETPQGARASSSPDASAEQHRTGAGKGPECPEDACLSLAISGDLLLHEGLWSQFAADPQRADGANFDFTPLLQQQRAYLEHADVAVCQAETPVAPAGGPYAAYPEFNVPPEILGAAKDAGYDACTSASNHAVDQGVPGVERTIRTMDAAGLQHTGSYASREDAEEPMVVDTPTGKLAVVAGTNSLNEKPQDTPWRIDRLRDGTDPRVGEDTAA